MHSGIAAKFLQPGGSQSGSCPSSRVLRAHKSVTFPDIANPPYHPRLPPHSPLPQVGNFRSVGPFPPCNSPPLEPRSSQHLSRFTLHPPLVRNTHHHWGSFLQWCRSNSTAATTPSDAMQAYLLELSNPGVRAQCSGGSHVRFQPIPPHARHHAHPLVRRHRHHTTQLVPHIGLVCWQSLLHPNHRTIYGIILTALVFLLRVSEASALRFADIRPGRIATRNRTVCWRARARNKNKTVSAYTIEYIRKRNIG